MDPQLTPLPARNALSRTRRPDRARRGVALLLVLVGLAILSVMILSLFLNVSSELQTSKVYASASSAKLLSQTAVDLVKAQIYQATSGCAPGTTSLGSSYGWASQPGMIRTYDTNGAPAQFYKLYSDGVMSGSGAFDHTNPTNCPPNGLNGTVAWYTQQGVYVDLNQPISVNGTNQYPILDGDVGPNDLVAMTYPNTLPGLTTPTPAGGNKVMALGPLLPSGYPQVSGFWVNSNVSGSSTNSVVNPNSPNLAPMPVKWLYVLRDGKLAVPDTDGAASSIVTFKNSAVAPSASDPITGRIAFWTDDETAKVNINTASEASYNNATTYATSFNDTPRVCTPYDLNLAQCPPQQNEFQRYPGHPATVSLSTVFGNLTTSSTFPENVYSSSASSPGIAPRTVGDMSTEATQTNSTTVNDVNQVYGTYTSHLYATPDEILLNPSRNQNSATIDQAALRRAQFFITASSRAPDVNLFNLPRVCLWPIREVTAGSPASTYQSTFDKLVASCTTLNTSAGEVPYYFQRSSYTSQTEETSISRNATLIGYLKSLCSTAIPGFTSTTFAQKYATATGVGTGTEMDQILTEIFDYIRCVNISDPSITLSTRRFNSIAPGTLGCGVVVPSYNATNGTKGFGRFPTISQAGILFICAGNSTNPQIIKASGGAVTLAGPPVPANYSRVQAALLFQLFDPSQGYSWMLPDCSLKVTSCNLTWNAPNDSPYSSSTMFPSTATIAASGIGPGWGGSLGTLGTSFTLATYPMVTTVPNTSTPASPLTGAGTQYPDFSTSGTPITFSGNVTVELVEGSTVVQTVTFVFPTGTSVAAPAYVSPATPLTSTTSPFPTFNVHFTNFNDPDTTGTPPRDTGRFDFLNNHNAAGTGRGLVYPFFITSKDIMESVQSVSGDLRLIAAQNTIGSTSTLFGPHPLYGKAGQNLAHSFVGTSDGSQAGNGLMLYGATHGQLVTGVTSYWSNAAAVALTTPFNNSYNDPFSTSCGANTPIYTCEPLGFGSNTVAGAQGVTAGSTASWKASTPPGAPGDFDNGAGPVCDGPYINKPDEGALTYLQGSTANYPYFLDAYTYSPLTQAYVCPGRQMPSAVMLGSLPTGVVDNRPWQTLLFHPDYTGLHVGNAAMGGNGNALAGAPADHLLLDLFTMPVVEPYAISEPFSTAGRINMNYLIVPFTYINRDTGLRAVLESQQMLAIPNTNSGTGTPYGTASTVLPYKQASLYANLFTSFPAAVNNATPYPGAPTTLRFSINLDETMKGFINRFYPQAISSSSTATPDIFHSPSEICTLPLVPNDTTVNPTYNTIENATATGYWPMHQLTGDNSRERPYANIYPLLTTKSNTFTVHFRAQSLLPASGPGANPAQWREGTDVITSEYRGSQTLERYVDLSSNIPDYAGSSTPTTLTPLSTYYRFRVVSTKQFSP